MNKEIKEIEIRITTKDVIDIENWEDEGGSVPNLIEPLTEEDIADMKENDSIGG